MAILLLVLTVCSIFVSSTLGRSKLLLETKEVAPSSLELDPSFYCDRDYSCLGCSTVRVCAPTSDGKNLYEVERFNCGSTYPYCNYTSGSCSSSPDPSCYVGPNTTVSTNFTCMRDGYFPDPYNCSLYYHCQNEVPYQFSCSYPNSYYHPEYQYCVSYNYYCTDRTSTVNCQYSSNAGRKLPVSYTNNYFLYCGLNNTVVAVDRCIGAYTFSTSAQICQASCPNAGLFPKTDNCTNYYKCIPYSHETSGGFNMIDMTCPEGQGFLESEYSCVNSSHVPNCYKPYRDLFSK